MICSRCENEYEDDGKKSSMCPDCRSAQGRRSKRKGSSNERRFAHYLQSRIDDAELNIRVRRTPASGAIHEFEPADIMVSGKSNVLEDIHFENKNTAHWDIHGWMADALRKEEDCGRLRKPLLVIRRPNDTAEFGVMRIEDLVDLLITLERLKKHALEE